MRTSRLTTRGVPTARERATTLWKRVVWLLVVAAGLTVGHAHVASAADGPSLRLVCEPGEGGTTYPTPGVWHDYSAHEVVEIVAFPPVWHLL